MLDIITQDPYDELFEKLIYAGSSEDEAEELLALVIENKNCEKIYELLNDTPVYDVRTLIYETQVQFKQMDDIANELYHEYMSSNYS